MFSECLLFIPSTRYKKANELPEAHPFEVYYLRERKYV